MLDVDLGFFLGAGLVAAFNPCGFAMLPAYLSYFLGLESDEETDQARNILRGITVGLTMSLGFVFLFGVIGVLTETVLSASALERNIGWATLAFGVLMVPLGLAMLKGYEPKLALPRFQKGTGSRDLPSVFLFGVSYGVVSVSCTAPLFLGTVVGSFTRESFVDGLGAFLAYAIGMSLVIMVLTLGLAMARSSIATHMRRFLPYVNRVSGAMLSVAGVVLAIYGWWEIRIQRDATDADNPVAETLNQASARLQNWVNTTGTNRFATGVGIILVGAIVIALRSNLRRPSDRRLALGALVAIWGLSEFVVYRADLFVLPLARTIADVPERVGNWFSDPGRWPVLWEVLLAALLAVIAWYAVQALAQRRQSSDRPRTETVTA